MEPGLLGIVSRIFTGAAIGVCIGMTGIGGGAIVVPVLTLGFGMTPSMSVGTASLYTFLTKIYATYRHVGLKTISYRISWIFLVGALPGNAIASWYVNHRATTGLDESLNVQFQADLKRFIATVMLASAGILLLNLVTTRKQKNRDDSEPGKGPGGPPHKRHIGKALLGVLLGACVGAIVGATALGVGVLGIPVLLICFGIAASQAVGTSIFIGLILTLISSLIYGKGGQIHIVTALLMSLGSVVGVYYGSRAAVTLPETKLKLVVIGIIAIATSGLMYLK